MWNVRIVRATFQMTRTRATPLGPKLRCLLHRSVSGTIEGSIFTAVRHPGRQPPQ